MKIVYLLFLLSSLICGTSLSVFAQIGGNQVYGQHNNQRISSSYTRTPVQMNSIVSDDAKLTVRANVLLNKAADYYLISIGASQEAKTVVECNEALNKRIDLLKKSLRKLGIKEEAIYVDFVVQIKTYDHKINGNYIEEFFTGFEIKKNILVKTRSLSTIDQIIERCSEQEIYDIIKVEYFNEDTEAIYDTLFEEAMEVIETKKNRFLRTSSVKLEGNYRLTSDQFNVYNPKNLYKSYEEAFESSIVNVHYTSSYVKKTAKKSDTYYYEGVATNLGLDRVLDEISPLVGIQYTLSLEMVYELQK